MRILFTIATLAILSVASAWPVEAQDGWDRYERARLTNIVEEHGHLRSEDIDSTRVNQFGIQIDFPVCARVHYGGELRSITGRSRAFIDSWGTARGLSQDALELYTHEALMLEGDVPFWMPIQRDLAAILKQQIQRDAPLDVYVQFAGLVIDDEETWYFVITRLDELDE